MGRAIGVLAMEHIAVGLVEDHRLVGPVRVYPDDRSARSPLQSMPADQIAETICAQMKAVAQGRRIDAIGIGFPGVIRYGVVEESPNLPQVKGFKLESTLAGLLSGDAPVSHAQRRRCVRRRHRRDARAPRQPHPRLDAGQRRRASAATRQPTASGRAATWSSASTRRRSTAGAAASATSKASSGARGMRLRFLDLEPEEVFANASAGDQRCAGLRSAMASRARRGHRDEHPPGRAWPLLLVGSQRELRRPSTARSLPARDGDDEPAAGERVRARRGERRNRHHRCGRQRPASLGFHRVLATDVTDLTDKHECTDSMRRRASRLCYLRHLWPKKTRSRRILAPHIHERQPHSARSDAIGSTREARRAGQ